MTYRLTRTPSFERYLTRLLRRHPDATGHLRRVLADPEQDPHVPRLRLHALRGELEGLHAVWVAYDYRLVLELHEAENEILLVSVGTHDEVYG